MLQNVNCVRYIGNADIQKSFTDFWSLVMLHVWTGIQKILVRNVWLKTLALTSCSWDFMYSNREFRFCVEQWRPFFQSYAPCAERKIMTTRHIVTITVVFPIYVNVSHQMAVAKENERHQWRDEKGFCGGRDRRGNK